MVCLRVASLNARGMKMLQRRTSIYLSLKMSIFDVCFLQECHLQGSEDVSVFSAGWEVGPSCWGVGNVKADGVGILFYSWEFIIESANVMIPGRVLVVDARWRGVALRFVNVYVPSKLGDRRGFLDNLTPALHTNRLLILGGDFNMSLDNVSGKELAVLADGFSLQDSFRGAGGREPTFTWWGSGQEASRLDYIFFPAHVRVYKYTQQLMWCSDHCLVGTWAEVGGMKRGRGVWRFNTSFLKDRTFCVALYNLVTGWKNLRGLYETQAAWWEGFKERVAFFCHSWGREKARYRRAEVGRWSEELQSLWAEGALGTMDGRARARYLQGVMKDFYWNEAKSFLLWTGAQRRLFDERPTKFFFSTVRGRQRRSFMEGLRKKDGGVETTAEGMLRVAEGFYRELFNCRGSSGCSAEKFWMH